MILEQQRQINELLARVERLERGAAEAPEAAEPKAAETQAASAGADPDKPKWVVEGDGPVPSVKVKDEDDEDLFSFKPRGRLFVDGGVVQDDDGFYDTNATQLRAARLGVEGTAWRDFGYRLEVDFGDDEVDITDAYIEYKGELTGPARLRVGQFKTPNSLEEQTSSRFITFMERAAFTDAFGFDRRIGAGALAGGDVWSLSAGIFGQNAGEVAEDEGFAAAARGTYAYEFGENRLLHLGASGRYRDLGNDIDGDTVSYSQRPFFAFTDIRSIDTGDIENAEADYLAGGEAALVLNSFSLQGEAAHTWLSRTQGSDVDGLWGGYLSASYFLTGETRTYEADSGTFDRIDVLRPLQKGGPGAWEIAARVDYLDLNGEGLDIEAGEQISYIGGVNWYPNPHTRLMLNGALTEVDEAADVESATDGSNSIYGVGVRAQVDF